jgi:hypothetical protein
MKNLLLIISLFLCVPLLYAQSDYSGSYGYSLKPKVKPSTGEESTGPSGNLVLLKMENSKYRFWLDVTIGAPSYNKGETDGTIIFVNDTASFDNTFEGATSSCILKFEVANNNITISSLSTSFNCGFGNGVNADGDYAKLKIQPPLDNVWLQTQYPESPKAIIITNKAEVFKDDHCLYSKNYFFKKGESVFTVDETEKTVYTEYITPTGKFIYGWIKKTSVKIENE